MAVTYVLVERSMSFESGESRKIYAKEKISGSVTLRSLCKDIARNSLGEISDTDVLFVLNELTHIMVDNLSKGRIIRLDNIGTFHVGILSQGAQNPDEFNTSFISASTILFRPGLELRKMLATLKYEKVMQREKRPDAID